MRKTTMGSELSPGRKTILRVTADPKTMQLIEEAKVRCQEYGKEKAAIGHPFADIYATAVETALQHNVIYTSR